MAYRFRDPSPVQFNLLGTASAAGGSLTFYDKGTTTPKNTYSDEALTIPNTNPVLLDSSGRPATEIWLDGAYTVILKAEDTTEIWETDVTPEVAPGLALPDPVGNDGDVVVADGTGYSLETLLRLPDPTGSASYMVVANSAGDGYILQAQPAAPVIPDPDITIASQSIRIGDGGASKLLVQAGSATIPASASRTSSVVVTFPTAYSSLWAVIPVFHTTSVGTYGIGATITATGYTPFAASPSATINANSADDGGDSGYEITNSISVTWVAIGLVAA